MVNSTLWNITVSFDSSNDIETGLLSFDCVDDVWKCDVFEKYFI